MIDILHRETGAVLLTVEGEWRHLTQLPYAFLDGIDLHGACLVDAELYSARLRGATLVDTDLTDAYLVSADCTDADLSGATLRRSDCSATTFRRANLTNADLSYAALQWTDWRGAILTGANLARATMRSGRYDQFTVWPEGFVPEKHHLRYVPSTSKRRRDAGK